MNTIHIDLILNLMGAYNLPRLGRFHQHFRATYFNNPLRGLHDLFIL